MSTPTKSRRGRQSKADTTNWSRENLAWVAGVLEGDGFITLNRNVPQIGAAMSDLDVLQRVQGIVGSGSITGPYKQNGMGRKPMYYWRVGVGDKSVALMAALWHWLGSRRRSQVADVVRVWKNAPVPSGLKTHCRNGHKYTNETTYVENGYRRCRPCRADAAQRVRDRKKGSL